MAPLSIIPQVFGKMGWGKGVWGYLGFIWCFLWVSVRGDGRRPDLVFLCFWLDVMAGFWGQGERFGGSGRGLWGVESARFAENRFVKFWQHSEGNLAVVGFLASVRYGLPRFGNH